MASLFIKERGARQPFLRRRRTRLGSQEEEEVPRVCSEKKTPKIVILEKRVGGVISL